MNTRTTTTVISEINEYLTLAQAANLLPRRPSAGTLWRWARKGVRARTGERVHLRHVRQGGRLYTTVEWLDQFGESLAALDLDHYNFSYPNELKCFDRDHERAEAELRRAGL